MTSSIQVSELLPCPFCGDSANLEHWGSEVSILCSNCNVRSAPFFAENEAQAIAAWNMRSKDHSIALDDVQVMNARSIAKHQISIGNEPLGNIINDLCDRITAIGGQSNGHSA